MRKPPTGVIQYDAAANEDPKEEGFGFNKIEEYIDMVAPDVVMIYNDPLIIHRFIENMKHERGKSSYKLWVYVDQVYDGIAQLLIDTINTHADRVYCFTEKWANKFKTYDGDKPQISVMEHAVDPKMFTNMSADVRKELRTKLKVPENGTIILNANRNSQRKRLDLTIAGFVRFLKKFPDSHYYLMFVTNINPKAGSYYDVNRIYGAELELAGLSKEKYVNNLLIVDTSPPNAISDEVINQIYNISDIGINTSDGEGFGLCQLEHLYTGAPQIVTDVGDYASFMGDDVSTLIRKGERVYSAGNMPLGFYAPTFSAEDVSDSISSAVLSLTSSKRAAASHKFKSWSEVCEVFRNDILAEK
jgi:glycosyltransferase involved in cell wall biosynthesis